MVANDDAFNPGRFEYVELDIKTSHYIYGKGARRFVTDGYRVEIPEAGYPTIYPPGTQEKLEVMTHREDRKELLFHPYDARYEGDPRPIEFLKLAWDIRERIVKKQLDKVLNRVAVG